ncbi:MAG TPA: triose-phosphate isomerase [Gemmatimonadales bacterium]|nr:triose-phosphate isomerase [Gemmatimonadales bacterium]
MRPLIFAGNWKMNVGPTEAREYMRAFFAAGEMPHERSVWFFPPAVSIDAVAQGIAGHRNVLVGSQDIYWEPKGAFTGAISGPLAKQAGARLTLIGHSERRHVFGETDEETRKKVSAALAADLQPVLCVGETLAQREAGETLAVVTRQLEAALGGRDAKARVTVAYEPVWAIGTGRNATPKDAAEVHHAIRAWLKEKAVTAPPFVILYGGSVNLKNTAELLAEHELDGVLVGGASLEARGWAQLVRTPVT